MTVAVVYRSFVLIGSILLLLAMTFQLWYTANIACSRLVLGGQRDTGIYPKRSRNINAWYIANPDDESTKTHAKPDGTKPDTPAPYPPVRNSLNHNFGKYPIAPARIGFANTTSCPIFRSEDNGTANPPLIG